MTVKRQVPGHRLKLGDHVYQRVNAWIQGTVTKIDSLSFTITYDGHDRQARQARMKFSYPVSRMEDFLVGRPNPDLLIWDKELEATKNEHAHTD